MLDMIGFWKYGHNEVDEPSFTQPHMYAKIRAHSSVASSFATRLIGEGVVKEEFVSKMRSWFIDKTEEEFKAAADFKPLISNTRREDYLGSWSLTHKWS